MKKFRNILSGISIHNRIIIIFALIAGLIFLLLNIGSNFFIDLIISESLENQADYKLAQVVNNFDSEFLHISNTLDNFVMDETVETYVLRNNDDDASPDDEYISSLFRILESSVNSFEFFSVMDDEGTVLRYGNAYDKSIDDFENEIQRDIYNRRDVGKLKIKYGMTFSKDKYGVEKRITFISKNIV